jgi:dihydropteroate synthase
MDGPIASSAMTARRHDCEAQGLRWAGFDLGVPRVMGILNVTPDSFSDGGQLSTDETAVVAGRAMLEAGADILDIGGESTRPGAEPVAPDAERARILPVIRTLAEVGAVISVDTRNATTMAAALAAGARIVNDVSALTYDGDAARVVAKHGAPVVLMHMRGTPLTMQDLAGYEDVGAEVAAELVQRIAAAETAGIARAAIALDPGIGFAKTGPQNIALLRNLGPLAALGFPLVVGLSRKGFIGTLTGEPVAARRLGGSIAGAIFALTQGARVLRVHDVAETVQAIRVWRALE